MLKLRNRNAVEVWFDPAQVSYAQLLQTFWQIHNPATRYRQGFDFGSQYRYHQRYLEKHGRTSCAVTIR